uniref:Putative NAD dependant epimerase n=1 Tax=termite gut metagenome TaxID=433724 RepID=S0DDS9_9ZZZZ
MKNVTITGTAGLLGPYVVRHFLEQGYQVLSVDRVKPAEPLTRHMTTDLNNLGECYGILENADAVVHLAAIPTAYIYPNEVTFQNNVMGTYNVLEAAAGRGIKKAVVASSECAYGVCNSRQGLTPVYFPVDEDHPALPEDCYGIGKVVGEVIADGIHRRSGMQIVSFRLGNIITKEKYLNFPGFIHDPTQRKRILWNYIDARDIATACQLAIEADGLGSIVMNLAADDNCTAIKSRELVKAEYPNVTDIRGAMDGYQTLYANEKAKRVLGWKPVHFWRDNVPPEQQG